LTWKCRSQVRIQEVSQKVKSYRISWFLTLSLCLGGGTWSRGQNIKGTITGLVQDSSQRVLPGAEVVFRSLLRESTRTLVSDSGGFFHQSGLDPGAYQVLASLPGFRSYQSEELHLEVGEVLRLEIQLGPSGLDTVVDVSAQVLQLDENKQAQGFDTQEMNDLPVEAGGQGRNFYAQARTAPGVALSTLAHRPFAVSGQRPRNNNYMVDSVEMNDADSGYIAGRGVTEQLISQEAVQSFEIISHNYKAEFGRNSGSIVNLVTKSGADQFHGSGYWYHGNSALSARSPLELEKSPYLSNMAGFTFGGPLKKDKAYLFGNYEINRPRGTTLASFRTLTDAQRARAAPSVCSLAALYPASPTGARVFTQGVPRAVDGLTYLLRGDLTLTERQQLAFRTSFTRGITDSTAIGDTVASDVIIRNKTRGMALHHSYTASPSLFNELRFGYMRLIQLDSNFEEPILLGDPAVNGSIGFMIVQGLSLAGPLSFLGRNQTQNNYQLSDDISWVQNNHVLKFGTSLRRVQVNGGTLNNAFLGSIFFPNIDAFLAGQPLSYNQIQGNPQIGLRRWEWHGYLQDDWKLARNFTLNLGIRYELNTSPTEVADRIAQSFRFVEDRNNFAPRLGFAWSPASETVIRGGYGIFYNAVEMAFLGLTRFNPPLLETFSVFRPTFPDLLDRARRDLPSGLVVPDPGTTTPYAQHLNLTVQRQLWNPQSTVSVAYVGTLGRHLTRNRRPNGGENLGQADRPDPSVGVINRLESSASSTYHALQVALRQQMTRDLKLRVAYTYSRFLDDVSEIPTTNTLLDPGIIPLDEGNLRLDWGPSDFDIPHIFTLSSLYRLPLFDRNRWLGGWSVSAITSLQSGRPYTVYSGTDTATGSNNNRINDIAGSLVRVPSSATPLRLLPGFVRSDLIPEAGALGTLGRNTERRDGVIDWNLSLSKDFALSEEVKAQFRGELFNAFNVANFDEVDNTATSPSFGGYLTTFQPRRIQLALRVFF